jgi:DNA-binding MarR family transcriptional regulator
MQPNNALGYLLQHVSSILSKQSDQVLQERLGIGFSQFKLLMALRWNPATSQRAIADSLGQTEASISRQIKLMYDKGLLHSSINPDNRRQHLATPTAQGVKLTEAALEVLNGFHQPTFAALNPRQASELVKLLTLIHNQVSPEQRDDAWYSSIE